MNEKAKLDQGNYGPVAVWAGPFKGKVGYYDDDDGASAIVYFEEPFKAPYAKIQRRWLTITADHAPTQRFIETNPLQASVAGVVGKRK